MHMYECMMDFGDTHRLPFPNPIRGLCPVTRLNAMRQCSQHFLLRRRQQIPRNVAKYTAGSLCFYYGSNKSIETIYHLISKQLPQFLQCFLWNTYPQTDDQCACEIKLAHLFVDFRIRRHSPSFGSRGEPKRRMLWAAPQSRSNYI